MDVRQFSATKWGDKTKVMIIAPDDIITKIRQIVGGLSASYSSEIRNLGVIFHSSFMRFPS